MAFSDGDWKIFAAGLAIGAKYNHTHGTLPRVESSVSAGIYSSVFTVTLYCDLTEATIMYSTDGSTPTEVYDGNEIIVQDDLTIYAYAVYGQKLSLMSKFVYVIYVPEATITETLVFDDLLAVSVEVSTPSTLTVTVTEAFSDSLITITDSAEGVSS